MDKKNSEVREKLLKIHEKLHFKLDLKKKHRKIYDHKRKKILGGELPEQLMVVRYLKGNERVLEIGGNIGRNSLVISSILGKNSENLVVLESDRDNALKLKENREINNMKFHIEASALSVRKLIQKDWNTIVCDKLLPGYKEVDIISFKALKKKYNIKFDTLVLDCEGAFYYILKDMPEILENIKLIITENDYSQRDQKLYVDTILKRNNFYVDYNQPLPPSNYLYGKNKETEGQRRKREKRQKRVIKKEFYQVWKRKIK